MMLRPHLLRVCAATIGVFVSGVGFAEDLDLVGLAQKEQAAMSAAVAKKREAVAEAISKAAKAGHLKTSTEVYYRDALEKIGGVESLAEPERLYFPPRFDTSEEMEPINLAWAALREEIRRGAARGSELSQRIRTAAAEGLLKAARSGTKGSDLDEVDRLLSARRLMPMQERMPSYTSSRDSLPQLSSLVRAVLDATQEKDANAIVAAFGRYRNMTQTSFESASAISINPSAVVEELRKRVSAPFLDEAKAAQQKAEQAIMRAAPAAEVAKAISEFQGKQGAVERLRDSSNTSYSYQAERSSSLIVTAYRAAMQLQEWLKSEDVGQDASPGQVNLPTEGAFSASPEFQAHVAKLNGQTANHRRKIAARAQEREQAAERERQMQAQERQRVAVEEARKEIKGKLEAVQTAEAAMALADQLPADGAREQTLNWAGLAAEVRSIARWWLDGDLQAAGQREAMTADVYGRSHPFVAEMRRLRERAVLEVAVKRLKLPQLAEPPLAEMEISDALERITQEAGARADWKQAYQILQLLVAWEKFAQGPRRERMEAIRNYLVGQNYEEAGQGQQAAAAYLQVIQTVGDHLPTKEAAARLKKLKAESDGAKKAAEAEAKDLGLQVDAVPLPGAK